MMRRVLRVRAADVARMAETLGRHDASWGSEVFDLAGGRGVLWGSGLYVNRAFAAGHDRPVESDDFELLEARSAAHGVAAAIEITPATTAGVREAAVARGYAVAGSVVAMRRRLHDVAPEPSTTPRTPTSRASSSAFLVEPAGADLHVWQETSAAGWGHTSVGARRASDAFAAATAAVDGDGFVVARLVADGRPVGCASVTLTGGVATLGAMSTVPTDRRLGVHAALIEHRLRFAAARGCDVAVTTAAFDGDSARNLRRLGFEPWFAIETLARPAM